MRNVQQYTLTTARLTLIPFTDETALFLAMNREASVRKYLWDGECIPDALATAILEQNAAHFSADGYGLWKADYNGTTIGYVGLWHFADVFPDATQPQLLYVIREPYTGNGFGFEAAKCIMQYAKDALHYTYLHAATDPPNIASQHLAAKLGFALERKIAGNETDGRETWLYSIML